MRKYHSCVFKYSCFKQHVPFLLQLPVSVYESVIDIISGEVLFKFHIIYISFPAAVTQFPTDNCLSFI